MMEKRKPITVSEAVKKVMNFKIKGSAESVPIEQTYGRYLAEQLKADHDVPPFDRSPYDGFAIRAEDTERAGPAHPVLLEVIDEIGAGFLAKQPVGPFQAVRLMTGAQIPSGCDAVIMLELTKEIEQDGKKYVQIKRKVHSGDNISFQGEDVEQGASLVSLGSFINPGIQALLATFGYAKVKVAKQPVIGVYATGSELLDVDQPLAPGKIRNSNAYMILGQIERSGAKATYFGKMDDEFELCYTAVKEALEEVDILITTGGVSVGDFDYLPAIYEKLGANVLFNKVAMRPGSVTTVAEFQGKLLFGLSGNPSACYVGYELFVRPIVRTMLYSSKPHLQKMKAKLGADFPKANPFTRFVRSKLEFLNGQLVAVPSGFDKSSSISSLAEANVLMELPGGTRGYTTGDEIDILWVEDQIGSEWPWD